MRFKLPRSSLKNTCNHCGGHPRRPPKWLGQARQSLFLALLFLFFSASLFAFPDQEKANLNLVSSQATTFIRQDDQFLFLSFSNKIFRIDTETFALTDSQVPLLVGEEDVGTEDLGGDVTGLAIRGGVLFAAQNDGDLLRIDLDDIADVPQATHLIDGTLGAMVADTEAPFSDDQLYILDPSTNSVIVFDISDDAISFSVTLVDSLGSAVTPEAIVFVPVEGGTDKIYITSDRGLVFVLNEGGTSIAATITLSATNKDLPAAAAGPDGDFLFVVDATDSVVHVIDTATNTEVDTDQIPIDGGVNPITLNEDGENSSLSGIIVTEVARPDDIYAFVAGSSGLSVIDLNLSLSGIGTVEVIDFNDTGTTDDIEDPMNPPQTPVDLIASSVDDGYVYSSNDNASVSVITDKPFVTITDTSLDGGTLSTDGTFNLTFQSDEAGAFRVVVGGDSSGNGTEVATGPVDVAGVDVTTPDIAFDSSLFAEGANRVFVFVTALDGLIGRDAEDITVDTPPPGIEVLETTFGDQKIFVVFRRLEASDIASYNLYVDTSAAAVATKSEVAGTLSQPSSGDEVRAKIVGLENGVTYFVGIAAVDESGNEGVRTTTFPDGTPVSETPEETVGLAQAVGEGGCSLIYERH